MLRNLILLLSASAVMTIAAADYNTTAEKARRLPAVCPADQFQGGGDAPLFPYL